MKTVYWSLLALCSNLAAAADLPPPSANVPTLGITADAQYPVYKISEVVRGQYFIVGGEMYSNADLLGRMVIITERDAGSARYQCDFLCRNGQKQVVGINPLYVGLMQQPLRPAVAQAQAHAHAQVPARRADAGLQ
ncbi:MAG: hypothetical protein M3R60_06775 [Pseudomonadota bacterium]|nr:hypothetical protein [Pseudomonadota bacterium]